MVPEAWSQRFEQQYQRVKKAAQARGKTKADAERVAAKVVNELRRRSGEQEQVSPAVQLHKGQIAGQNYEERTREELYNLAVQRDIDGRSRMTKEQLIAALRN